jgi:4-amino-4-deoxy-L-arabinose transferase-like glycosyltransferase
MIILMGFGLRVYQLGSDSLWNDEAGVVLAALLPNLQTLISAIRSHAMAMPMDYLVIRGVIRLGFQEFVLRLPAAVFGTLTLAIFYRLSRKLIGEIAALFAVLLLALSPLHIMYSQEVRFYASLVFFFYLSVDLFIEAVEKSSPLNWALLLFILVVGIYFHIYVSLSLICGLAWAVMNGKTRQLGHSFALGGLFAAILLSFSGYLYFGEHQQFNYPLLPWGGSLFQEIALGLGWQELPFTPRPNMGRSWYILCFSFFLIGLMRSLKRNDKSVIALMTSSLIQIFLVIATDLLKRYWFVYRQILYLHPAMLMVSSIGLLTGMQVLKGCKKIKVVERWFAVGLIGVLLLSCFPALANYYKWPKSEARWISEYLSKNWEPGEAILVVPGYQEKVYRYYLQYVYSRPDIASWICPSEIKDITEGRLNVGDGFLIVVRELSSDDEWIAQLSKVGFKTVKIFGSKWLGQALFVRRQG